MEGRIVRIISNMYTVDSNNIRYNCNSRGRFRNDKITPHVGDIVTFDEVNNYIMEIKPRKNILVRPSVSNIDQALVVISAKSPEFSSLILDKFISIISFNNVTPIICLTKMDLLNEEETKEINVYIDYYRKIGYEVVLNTDLTKLNKVFKDKVTVFTGQSGVGKSTLINKLDKNLNLATNEISRALRRGKHTTRHVELFKIKDGYICDTPGFSSLELTDMTEENIRDSFIEFDNNKCEFRDCKHIKEIGCFVKEEVKANRIIQSRYDNYVKMIRKKEF